MIKLKESYIVNKKGNRIGVFLDIKDYQKVLDVLEELDSIHAYDRAKLSNEKAIPFSRAIAEIEKHRK